MMREETRIRKDADGWAVEARIEQAPNYFQWIPIGWTSGTKRDAERLEREIVTERKNNAGN
jgi:hypothetical protein